ncbi:hypothetical protein L810_6474 [Burkholderia sp. AU4i]|nr:hypothetical protein L810_6474 [Burkholderia sp. AU4i]
MQSRPLAGFLFTGITQYIKKLPIAHLQIFTSFRLRDYQ